MEKKLNRITLNYNTVSRKQILIRLETGFDC